MIMQNSLTSTTVVAAGAAIAVVYAAQKAFRSYFWTSTSQPGTPIKRCNSAPAIASPSVEDAEKSFDFIAKGSAPSHAESVHCDEVEAPSSLSDVSEYEVVSRAKGDFENAESFADLEGKMQEQLYDKLGKAVLHVIDKEKLSNSELFEINQIVHDISHLFNKFIRELLPNHQVDAVQSRDVLSSLGETPVLHRLDSSYKVDLMLPLILDSSHWEPVVGSDTYLNAPGYYMIKRTNKAFFKPGSSAWDKYLTSEYLSPKRVCDRLKLMVQKGLNWGEEYNVSPPGLGDNLVLTVTHIRGRRLVLEITPVVRFAHCEVEAAPHPRASVEESHNILWRECFAHVELTFLMSLTPPVQRASATCIRALLTLTQGKARLFVVNLVLQALESDSLDNDSSLTVATAQMFSEAGDLLADAIARKHMSHTFNAELNLFEFVDRNIIEDLHRKMILIDQ